MPLLHVELRPHARSSSGLPAMHMPDATSPPCSSYPSTPRVSLLLTTPPPCSSLYLSRCVLSQVFKHTTVFFSQSTPNLAQVIPVMGHINKVLTSDLGFQWLNSNWYVYLKKSPKVLTIIKMHVDDMVALADTLELMDDLCSGIT